MPDDQPNSIADLHTLMTSPPRLRRGNTRWQFQNAPPAAGASFPYLVQGDYWERVIAATFRLTTSAAAGLRGVRVDFLDADTHLVASNAALSLVTVSTVITVVADQQWPSAPGLPASSNTYGTAAAPGAGATVATSPALPAGLYQVAWPVEVSGPVAAGVDNDNLILTVAGTTLARALYPAVAGYYIQPLASVWVPQGGQVIIKTIGAATAGTTYATSLTATMVASNPVQVQIPDLILKPGWSMAVTGVGLAAGDQLDQIGIMSERYPSNWADGAMGMDEERFIREWAESRGPAESPW